MEMLTHLGCPASTGQCVTPLLTESCSENSGGIVRLCTHGAAGPGGKDLAVIPEWGKQLKIQCTPWCMTHSFSSGDFLRWMPRSDAHRTRVLHRPRSVGPVTAPSGCLFQAAFPSPELQKCLPRCECSL